MNEWRDQTRIPLGLSDFGRWWEGTGLSHKRGVQPADVDGMLHNKKYNSFLMMEFKPENSDITTGQQITMKGFSKLPGCIAILLFDPHWDDDSRQVYDPDMEIAIVSFKDGVKSPKRIVTMRQVQERIAQWWEQGS